MPSRSRAGAETTATKTSHLGSEADVDVSLLIVVRCAMGLFAVPLARKGELVVGRDGHCDVVVDDASVSRRHARITIGEALAIEDLGSKNGTNVEGKSVVPGMRVGLSIGSVIGLGTATLVVQRSSEVVRTGRGVHRSARSADDDARGAVIEDPVMKRLYAMLDVVAPSPLSVLILGETGVGKEVFAQAVHDRSTRRDRALIQLNCAALPESLLEAELFGYEKGAFTGATQAKPGLFEAADGGTVFLDEIGELPLATQAKLLRVLEGGHVQRLGSVRGKQVDVRFVSATNRDLSAQIAANKFRSDLFFRINGKVVAIPPLRARPTEVVPLARAFAERLCARMKRDTPRIAPSAADALRAFDWPGNVRQLRNVIERAVVLCTTGELRVEHLALDEEIALGGNPSTTMPAVGSPTLPPPPVRSPLDRRAAEGSSPRPEEERRRIVHALEAAAGNQSRAAKDLGISRHTLLSRLDEYGLSRPRKGR